MKTLQTPRTILLVALIALTVGCGYSSKMTAPVAGMMPTVSALAPNSATAGGAAFTMTVNGTNFAAKAVVNLNGTAQTSNTTFVSASQLTVAVPASAIATAGTISITVTNPATAGTGMYGGGGTLAETSAPMSFTVN
jgi:hypothetical protein